MTGPINQPWAAPARRSPGAHNPALDGLRGVAVLLVMASHWAGSAAVLGIPGANAAPFRIGWAGVDVFFALSGFLITGILLDGKRGSAPLRAFYLRRVLRICPLYVLAILVVAALRCTIGADPAWGDTGSLLAPGSLLWPSLYLENWAITLEGPWQTGILTHYWSLAVEEHFYLLWPLLVFGLTRRGLAIAAGLAVAVSVAGRLAALAAGLDPAWIMGLTPLRMDGLALGALASLAVRCNPPPRAAWAGRACAAALAALAGLVAARHSLSQSDPWLWVAGYTLAAAAAAALIVYVTRPGPAACALSHPVLRWFGRYSFGLYVWHPIIAVLLLHSRLAPVQPGDGPVALGLALAAAVAITLAAAWASYHGFERRFLELKRFVPMDGPLQPMIRSRLLPAWKIGR